MTTSFSELGLCEELAAAMADMGFAEPTEIQQKAVPRALAGANIAGQAPTGTGKTFAYLLPLLQNIDPAGREVQAVVLAPTYELAMQIAEELRKLVEAGHLTVRSQALIGGANIARQMDKLKKKPQVIVGSAGRITELVHKGKLHLQQVKLLVLDEFDRLLDDQNQQSIADLVHFLPKDRQVLLFSATAPKKALERAGFLAKPEIIRSDLQGTSSLAIENLYVIVPFRDKIEMLRKLTRTLPVQRGLVFINKAFDAEQTLAKLRYDGIRAESLLGSADKMSRKNAVQAFRKGKIQLLLSTDLAARGLDIDGIDYVFNLDLPESGQVYQHRAGRTARAGAAGRAVTLVDLRETGKLAKLEQSLGIHFQKLERSRPVSGKKHRKRTDSLKS